MGKNKSSLSNQFKHAVKISAYRQNSLKVKAFKVHIPASQSQVPSYPDKEPKYAFKEHHGAQKRNQTNPVKSNIWYFFSNI